jgi:hypothetical protein
MKRLARLIFVRLIVFSFLLLISCGSQFCFAQIPATDWTGLAGIAPVLSVASGSWVEGQAIGLGLGSASPCTSATSTSCTWSMLPTVANSAFALAVITTNNVTISSVSWSCGGTWHTGYGGHVYDSAVGNSDTAYNIGNTGGCTSVTVNISGAPGNSIWTGIAVEPVEFYPPSGATVSLDQVSTVDDSTACSTCNLASFSSSGSNALTATDAVVQWNNPSYTVTSCVDSSPTSYSCVSTYSSTYQNDYNGNAIALNVPAGNLTGTAQQRNGSGPASGALTFTALAFKSSYGSFTLSPAQIWTPTSSDSFYNDELTCSPTCALTIPSTTGGTDNALVLCSQSSSAAGASAYISSVTDNNSETWSHISGARIGASGYGTMDCWWVPSDSSGVTTVTPSMNASGTYYYFGIYEFNKSTGAPSLDTSASTNNSGTSTSTPAGQALTLSGTDDLCFQLIQMPGATDGIVAVTGIPYPYDAWTNTNGQNYSASSIIAGAVGYTLNVASAPAPTWMTYDAIAAGSLAAAFCLY